MGWGIIPLLGDDVHVISVPRIVLSLLGIMGIVAMVKSVKDYIAVKNGKAPEVQDRGRSSQYQYEANARMAMSWDGNGAMDNPVTDFYREHKEGIDTTIRTVQKGRNIAGNIVMIAVGGDVHIFSSAHDRWQYLSSHGKQGFRHGIFVGLYNANRDGGNISGSWNICDSKRSKRFAWKVIRDKRNVPTRMPTRMEDYI